MDWAAMNPVLQILNTYFKILKCFSNVHPVLQKRKGTCSNHLYRQTFCCQNCLENRHFIFSGKFGNPLYKLT